MNKKILKIEFSYDFTLIGIIAPIKDYRLCWFLNNELHFNLEKTDDIIHSNAENNEIYFSRYTYFIDEGEIEYYLLTNRGSEGYLIPEHKEIDFFLMIHNLSYKSDIDQLLSRILNINIIQTALLLNANKLKSKENLLF
ncbi:IPExxxVDY family protein [Solitalea koreensis]|uniref:IPExxxVDY family protein n=1 Tax=Solitalea koreensis TaxID=543615 RepID=UPI00163D4745|nr:IPExxxVDY family protein [Solitalea koreensis]